ncbi:unnamed protein product [Adineta steineri]|uniref:Uncharacterized protein n=1 Tax=Adineta steineri TaxID=433720 RepID=A0A818JBN2_9BILA|nr:unnamed protein product [Adineta steineri]CAF0952451.1 unnamed protein product [Adineta steineri]CAF0972666.1 unnamed protein product [Adineta steineri]CAF3539111.1 unnamed protein product [Adineta steineri]CAF3678858.1 unnamed protein product [Adineta steineri]
MTTSDPRQSHNQKETNNKQPSNNYNPTNDVEVDSELLELETALNDIEKAMDKIESQNTAIQARLRDLLEGNREMTREFTYIRRDMSSKFKEVHRQFEQMPGISHDLAAVTSNTLTKIEQDLSNDQHKSE